jgi:hypothetical protein
MKTFFKIILLAFILVSTASAQFNKAGRTSMQFLKIGIGARQVGSGEANIAGIQDVNSVFWNPALLTGIENGEASFTYTQWIVDLKVLSGAVGYNFGFATVAFNYVSLDYGNIPEALVISTRPGDLDTRTGEFFSGSDLALGVGIAKRFTDKLSIGVNLRYIREDLFIFSSDLWAFDVGSFYDVDWKGIKIGMSAQNFSSSARWIETGVEDQQSFDLPLVFRIGVSMDLLGGNELLLGGNPEQHKFTLNADAIHTNDYGERLHLGFEYLMFNQFSLRGGYKFNYEEGNLALGAGVHQSLGNVNLSFDYSYVSFDFLQSPHRFTLLIGF